GRRFACVQFHGFAGKSTAREQALSISVSSHRLIHMTSYPDYAAADASRGWASGMVFEDESAPTAPYQTDTFHELLSTLASALDVRDVFRRLSAVAARIVPHDEANLALLTEDRTQFRLFASTRDSEPELVCAGKHFLVRDPLIACVFNHGFSDRGFRSGLRVPVRVDDASLGVLALLSIRPGAYSDRELGVAQRIADYVAIALSRQRLAEAAHRSALER